MNLSKPDPNDNKLVPLAHQEVRYRAAPTWTRALQWAIVGCIGFGFLYSVIARIDEVVIARGELKGIGAERPIKAPIAGVVSAIPISEGQLVTPGQVLVQFDPDVNEERLRSLQRQKDLESQRLSEETQAFEARTDSLNSKLGSLKLTLATEASIVNRMEGLMAQGAIAEVQYLQQKTAYKNCSLKSLKQKQRFERLRRSRLKASNRSNENSLTSNANS